MITFEWDNKKDLVNQEKHNVSFDYAKNVFVDPNLIIFTDAKHSTSSETRFYAFGECGGGVLTVRFTKRGNKIRIFGAGYWREGKKIYEKENNKK